MNIKEGVSLKRFNTFGVDAVARRAVQINSEADLAQCAFDPERDLVLGAGSNILFAGDVEGTVFLNRIPGMHAINATEDEVLVEAAGGEIWHSLVLWSLARDFYGLENLSLIPGLAGAAPIQNIGAYGVELSDVLHSVRAWDWQTGAAVELSREECGLHYRDSHFKSGEPDRYFIIAVRLRLRRQYTPRLDYPALADSLRSMGIDEPTAQQVSKAVIMIRKRRLPDPAHLGNAGSFFKNPLLTIDEASRLERAHPGLPLHADTEGMRKLSAAWLIEQCGWKGYRSGDAGVSEDHALVLVNHGKASGADILDLAGRIMDSVVEKYGIRLEIEPRVYGGTRTDG